MDGFRDNVTPVIVRLVFDDGSKEIANSGDGTDTSSSGPNDSTRFCNAEKDDRFNEGGRLVA